MLAAAVSAHVELSRRERERAEEAGMLRRLGEATSRLARVSDAAELEHDLCVAAQDLAGADGAILWTAAPGGMLRATAAVGLDVVGAELPPGHGAPRGRPSTTASAIYRAATSCSAIAGWGAALFEPLLLARPPGGRPDRVLERASRRALPERALQLIELLSSEAAVAIERTTTLTELEKLTRVDALTGIGNRRAFDEQLGRELKRAEREGNSGRARDVRLRPLQGLQRRTRPSRGRPAADARSPPPGRAACAPPTASPATAARSSR